MSETNALAVLGLNLPAPKPMDAKTADEMSSSDYLPYMVLHANNGKFAGPPHRIPGGSFTVIKDKNPHSLGESINVIPVSYRMVACKLPGKGERPDRCLDTASDKFELYKQKALNKDESDPAIYWFGAEVLYYLLDEDKLVTFFHNNKTSRRAFKEQIYPELGEKIVISSKFINNGTHQWWGFDVVKCSTDYAIPPDSVALIQKWATKFVENEVVSESVETDQER